MNYFKHLAISGVMLTALLSAGCVTPHHAARERQVAAQNKLDRGQQLLGEGLTEEALRLFAAAIEENPNLTEAHLSVGAVHRHRGDHLQARAAYQEAVRADPLNFDAHYYLGLMNQLLGDLHQSVRSYLQAVTLQPTSFEANRDLASAYLQLGRPGEAVAYARMATELNPDSQPAWSNLAATHALLHEYDKAIEAYRQAAELGELADPVLIGLADAHIRGGNYTRAINTLQSLIRQSPSATAYERLGFAYFKLKRYEESQNYFERALDLDPSDTAALNGLGVCQMTLYVEGGRENKYLKDQAIESWRRSVRIRNAQPRIVDLIARYGRL